VETSSKYTSATTPSLPTRRKSPADTIPAATHRNTSGAMAVRIRRKKMSPRILHCSATAGASRIWEPRLRPWRAQRPIVRRVRQPRDRRRVEMRGDAGLLRQGVRETDTGVVGDPARRIDEIVRVLPADMGARPIITASATISPRLMPRLRPIRSASTTRPPRANFAWRRAAAVSMKLDGEPLRVPRPRRALQVLDHGVHHQPGVALHRLGTGQHQLRRDRVALLRHRAGCAPARHLRPQPITSRLPEP
jgi:hypothetical protein